MKNEPIELPPPPPANMLGKTVLINFVVLLLLFLISLALSHEEAVNLMVFGIVAQAGFNFFFGIIFLFTPRWLKIGQSMMLAALVVALVGSGICWLLSNVS